jgi:hypothetical protein
MGRTGWEIYKIEGVFIFSNESMNAEANIEIWLCWHASILWISFSTLSLIHASIFRVFLALPRGPGALGIWPDSDSDKRKLKWYKIDDIMFRVKKNSPNKERHIGNIGNIHVLMWLGEKYYKIRYIFFKKEA